MDNGFQFFDIVLFAAVAGFLLLRLRSVLGRRTGNERRRPDPFSPAKPLPAQPAVGQPSLGVPVGAQPLIAPPGAAMSGALAIQSADPSFDEEAFLRGARAAFELIVHAFAADDTAALAPLLSKDVFAAFSEAMRARQSAKETLETTLLAVKSATIVNTTVEHDVGMVTAKIVSDQINVTRAADGKVLEGDPDKAVEKTDFWTFARPLHARDPNWTLVATHSP